MFTSTRATAEQKQGHQCFIIMQLLRYNRQLIFNNCITATRKNSLEDEIISRTFNIGTNAAVPPSPILLTSQPCNQGTDTSTQTA